MLGFVAARSRAHRLLLGAALLTVLLTTAVLTTLTAFSVSAGDAGLRRTLEGPGAARAVLDVRTGKPPAGARATAGADAAVRAAARRAFDGLPVDLVASSRSGSHALPGTARSGEDPDLTLFASLDPDRVRMTAGTWPRPGTAGRDGPVVTVDAALPAPVAGQLGLRTGDRLELPSRLDADRTVRARITGLYVPRDPESVYWRLDPFGGSGSKTLDFTTYGPLAVRDDVFSPDLVPAAERRWQADADFSGVTTARADRLRSALAAAVEDFAADTSVEDAAASGELPGLLDELDRALLVSRSALLVAALQLAVLAGLALLLVARLLAAQRAAETALLRARGASRAVLVALSAAEALLVTAPAALLAPLLAGPAVRQVMALGGLAQAGTGPAVWVPAVAWWAAALTAAVCAAAVAAPAVRRTRGPVAAPRRKGAAAGLRGGVDVALVALAGVAFWQLRRGGDASGVLTPRSGGDATPGVDPVLVVAPALALLAGTVVVLRLLPLLARLGERRAARGRGLSPALTGWRMSRLPHHTAGPALLLVLAVAMAVFAVGQRVSWDRSQGDQADHRVGADVRVTGSSAPPFEQGGVLDGVDGVRAASPVSREELYPEGGPGVQLLAVDATRPALRPLRGDLADAPLPGLLKPLTADPRSRPHGLPLPRDARALRLEARLTSEGPRGRTPGEELEVVLLVEDRHGVSHPVPAGALPQDGRPRTLVAPLPRTAQGRSGLPALPLRLTGVSLRYEASEKERTRRLEVVSLAASGPGGVPREVRVDPGQEWSFRHRSFEPLWGPAAPEALSLRTEAGAPLVLRFASGYVTGSAGPFDPEVATVPTEVTARPGPAPAEERPVPVVATDAFLTANGTSVGEDVKLTVAGAETTFRVTGAVRTLPTTEAGDPEEDGGALLADLATLNEVLQQQPDEPRPLVPEEWWVEVRPGADPVRVAQRVRAHPVFTAAVARDETAAALRGDPVGAGPRTALAGVTAAAGLLAATGFAVSAVGTVRSRRGEFAVLRALGTARRRVALLPAAEYGVVAAAALLVGWGLGALLNRLVMPLVVLTAEAERPVPELLVELPAAGLLPLLAAVVAVPVAVAVVTALRGAAPEVTLRVESEE